MSRWDDEIGDLSDRLGRSPEDFAEDQGRGYWDSSLESIFSGVNPGNDLGFEDEFHRSDEVDGRNLFYDGFVNPDLSPDERHEAREEFFDWWDEWGYDEDEFPWDEWREWYSEG